MINMIIEVKPIDNLLRQSRLKNRDDIAILFVTLRPNYYDFGATKFLQLTVKDSHGEDVSYEMYLELSDFLDYCKYSERNGKEFTIYVCCDAGLSRSPAFAKFVCKYLIKDKRADEIEEKFMFLNHEIYNQLVNLFVESVDRLDEGW